MNYRIHAIGRYNDSVLYEVMKLLIFTMSQADYETSMFSGFPENPFSNIDFTIVAKGSLKDEYKDIYLDFNNILVKNDKTIISKNNCGFDGESSHTYYFGMLGFIFKLVEDLNPAFVTGYLIEQKRDKDLKAFRENL